VREDRRLVGEKGYIKEKNENGKESSYSAHANVMNE
jgi:hypothetical protein